MNILFIQTFYKDKFDFINSKCVQTTRKLNTAEQFRFHKA